VGMSMGMSMSMSLTVCEIATVPSLRAHAPWRKEDGCCIDS
jgi:hypothetical protein